MNIVALVESETHVCCRYRVAAFRSGLAQQGYSLTIQPLPRSLFARLRLYRSLRSTDAVLVQRRLPSRVELALLRRWSRTLIYDFDDALWLRDSYAPGGFESPRRARRFQAMMSAADLVVAGNLALAEQARTQGATRTAVIPTCVEPDGYPLASHTSDTVRMVWIGSASTLQGLDRFRAVLDEVGHSVPGIRLKLICDRFLAFDHLPVERVNWSELTETAELAQAEIGISWVPDDPWSRGKCGLKVLQYQAAGLPVVANPVGVQTHLVRPDQTGFLATTASEWVEAIRRLASDPVLRQRMGLAGRAQVESSYSVAAGTRLWCDALVGLVRRSRQAS